MIRSIRNISAIQNKILLTDFENNVRFGFHSNALLLQGIIEISICYGAVDGISTKFSAPELTKKIPSSALETFPLPVRGGFLREYPIPKILIDLCPCIFYQNQPNGFSGRGLFTRKFPVTLVRLKRLSVHCFMSVRYEINCWHAFEMMLVFFRRKIALRARMKAIACPPINQYYLLQHQ